MSTIVGIAYCSRPVSFSFEQTDDILAVSRANNARAGITGALIYDNTAFLQALEGTPEEIRAVFNRISRDSRHTGIRLLSVRKLQDRLFPDWSMTAAVTQDQTLRGLKLVPHLSLVRFNPFAWSDADVSDFMNALSDYLTRRPAPKSEPVTESVSPHRVSTDPVARLDRHLDRLS
ncbi:BLUF domain-containing protein [Roseovarius ramblicola]|uniref:BLUF domain-containing protein n=1 Tax=Roseovarius ramblicola TaxID=2022336 RepID=A0ABV5I0V7_9RHOB